MKKLMVTIKEAADLLSCSTRTIRRMIEEGKLEAGKIRGCLRITMNSVDRYIDESIQAYQLENGCCLSGSKKCD